MPFEDLNPFKRRRPDRTVHYGISPTSDPEAPVHGATPAKRREVQGWRGQYRLIFQGMLVPDLPEQLRIEGVTIDFAAGPVATQRTTITQSGGLRPTLTKWLQHPEVGAGLPLTVASFPVTVGPNPFLDFIRWRERALASVGVLVGLLDERIAQRELGEDVVLFDADGRPKQMLDQARGVRHYPHSRVLSAHAPTIDLLASLGPAIYPGLYPASRWYLTGVQSGPEPDAIVSLWISLLALTPASSGGDTPELNRVTELVDRAGIDPESIEPSLGRIFGYRSKIVHGEKADPALLRPAFYTLEAIARACIRHAVGVTTGWPMAAAFSNLKSPWRELTMMLKRRPRIRWREPPGDDVRGRSSRAGFRDLYPPRLDKPALDLLRGDAVSGMGGRTVVYRLGFQSQEVPGLPASVSVGRVSISQVDGPIASQITEISQEPGDELIFRKWQRRGKAVGAGLPISICQVALRAPVIPDLSPWLSEQFEACRDEALGAAGLVAAVFDERLFQRELFEDLVILNESDSDGEAALDTRRRIRRFRPHLVDRPLLDELSKLRGFGADELDDVGASARWYLGAVQQGPTADAITDLWTAIEGLIGKNANKAAALKQALRDAGIDDTSRFKPDEMVRLRGAVLHAGSERPAGLDQGFLRLEAAARLLLRARHGLSSTWPEFPNSCDEMEPSRGARVAERWRQPPQVIFETDP